MLHLDIAHCGGISEIRRIAAMAEAYDVALAPHCPLGPIALAACMQVEMATPNFAIQEMGVGIHYNTEVEKEGGGGYDVLDYVRDGSVWDVKDEYVEDLSRIGLGIEVGEGEVREVSQRTGVGVRGVAWEGWRGEGVVRWVEGNGEKGGRGGRRARRGKRFWFPFDLWRKVRDIPEVWSRCC